MRRWLPPRARKDRFSKKKAASQELSLDLRLSCFAITSTVGHSLDKPDDDANNDNGDADSAADPAAAAAESDPAMRTAADVGLVLSDSHLGAALAACPNFGHHGNAALKASGIAARNASRVAALKASWNAADVSSGRLKTGIAAWLAKTGVARLLKTRVAAGLASRSRTAGTLGVRQTNQESNPQRSQYDSKHGASP
jgi:hypothetical protein